MWNWLKNFPVPEYQLGFLILGVFLHLWGTSRQTFESASITIIVGVILICLSVLLAIWAALSFGDEAMDEPETLRESGPYRFTRNPMYLSWFLVTAGLGMWLGSYWLIGLAIVAVAITQLRVIASEEEILTDKFGEAYERYRQRVPRWLWPI